MASEQKQKTRRNFQTKNKTKNRHFLAYRPCRFFLTTHATAATMVVVGVEGKEARQAVDSHPRSFQDPTAAPPSNRLEEAEPKASTLFLVLEQLLTRAKDRSCFSVQPILPIKCSNNMFLLNSGMSGNHSSSSGSNKEQPTSRNKPPTSSSNSNMHLLSFPWPKVSYK